MKLNSTIMGFVGNVLNQTMVPGVAATGDRVTSFKLGTVVPYLDDFWGSGELMYAQSSSVATIPRWGLCQLGAQVAQAPSADGTNPSRVIPVFDQMLTTTQYSARPLAIAAGSFSLGDFGWWFLSASAVPARAEIALTAQVACTCSPTLDANIQTTFSAGRAILGMATITTGADTFNVEVTSGGRTGERLVRVKNADGLFPGCRFVGTGIPASSFITSILGDGRDLIWSVPFTAQLGGVYTAVRNVSGTVTFPTVIMNRPMQIGQIV
jgi:hypothetical protein